MSGRTWAGWATATVLAVAGVASAGAALAPPAQDSFTARMITRLTLFDLRIPQATDPSLDDMELAYHMLGLAEELDPTNEHIARLRLEAAFATADAQAHEAQTRRVLELDPDDEISQLRLISSQITERAQTVDQRLRLYEAFVGDKGVQAGLSPAVRSRLALDGALLYNEQGNLEGFARMLETSLTLDSTHKEAASLAHAYFTDRVNDPIGRLDLLSNLLYADPVDPNVHDAIMRELAAGGAYAGALRFHQTQVAIGQGAGRGPDETMITIGLVLNWQINGPQAIADVLDRSLQGQRDQAIRNLRALSREGQSLEGFPGPDEIRLPAYQEVARIAAAFGADDEGTVDAAMTDLARTSAEQVKSLSDPNIIGEDVTKEQIAAARVGIMDRLTTMRLWTGRQLEYVEKDIAALDAELAVRAGAGNEQGAATDEQTGAEGDQAAPPADQSSPEGVPVTQGGADFPEESATTRTYRGWLALRRNDPVRAIELLGPLSVDRPFAKLGVALAQLDLGDRSQGLDLLGSVARDYPLTIFGAWARTKYEKITGEQFVQSPYAERMESWANGIPAWLDVMAVDPGRFITFEIEPVETTVSGVEASYLRLRIRNTSTIPLAFGPGRPISSRIMLVPRTDIGIERVAGGMKPEVFDIQRKLRLMPRETFETIIWPDPGQTGFFMDLTAGTTARTRWRAVQGYVVGPDGTYRPGPMGLSDEANESVLRLPLAEANHSLEELARRIREDSEDALPNLIATVRVRSQDLIAQRLTPEQEGVIAPLIQAAVDRYQRSPERTRLMMAATLQSERFFPPMAPFEKVVREDDDTDIRKVALLTRVWQADDPLIAEAKASADESLARIAELVERRLQNGRQTISKMQPARRQPAPGQP